MIWNVILTYIKKVELYYVGLIIFSYLVGFFMKDLNLRKIKIHIIKKSIVISLIVLVVGFVVKNSDIKLVAFTFSSVYLGFWLNEEMKKLDDKKRLKMYLGLLWQELRFNVHQLDVIKKNYGFYLEDIQFIEMGLRRFDNIHTLCKLLKTNAYQAYMNSGAISTLGSDVFKNTKEADDVFNTLEIAYNDIEYLRSFLEPVLLDFETKVRIRYKLSESHNISQYDSNMLNDLKTKIKQGANELAITYRTSLTARDKLDTVLDKLNVKAELNTERNSVLNDKDKDFIEKTLRIVLNNVTNPFQTPT